MPEDSIRELRSRIEDEFSRTEGVFALAFEDLTTGRQILINDQDLFHAASTVKTPVMIEVFRQAKAGRFRITDSVIVKNEFKSIVDGSPYHLDVADNSDDSMYRRIGTKASIEELVFQMITVSSNLATNLLIELVGARNVTASMQELGAPKIQVVRGVEDGKAFAQGLNNVITAFDLMVIMKAIAQGRAVDSVASTRMTEILLQQKFRSMIPALLPSNARIAHKTGSITGVQHDSGFVLLADGRTYVLVVLSKHLKDSKMGTDTIARVSRMIYDYMKGLQ